MHTVTDLPFNRFLGIRQSPVDSAVLELPDGPQYHNHLGTVHASAQLALAEASAGEHLLNVLQELGAVVAVVRRVEAKFRKPAMGRVYSKIELNEAEIAKTILSMQSKGRSLLTIEVKLYDQANVHTLSASFEWFLAVDDSKL
jgi:acyl-coenzyme A thioesterase PaaI-like protein